MDMPQDEPESQQEAAEHLRREAVAKAFTLFEQNPELAGALVQIHDQQQELERGISDEAKERLSEARLEHFLKVLDIRGQALLRLVTDLESQKAYITVMDDFVHGVWFHF